ncbi:MAG: hypothetical protein QXW80_04520 [Candidatus Micrarchaeia archaeon]
MIDEDGLRLKITDLGSTFFEKFIQLKIVPPDKGVLEEVSVDKLGSEYAEFIRRESEKTKDNKILSKPLKECLIEDMVKFLNDTEYEKKFEILCDVVLYPDATVHLIECLAPYIRERLEK